MAENNWDGHYINYDSPQYDGVHKYTTEETGAMFEVLAWLEYKGRITKDVIEFWHGGMRELPHRHQESIFGSFCRICHCNLPGPNGEWG